MANITTVYFIRHAETDQSVHEDAVRPLTPSGVEAAKALVGTFGGTHLDRIYSSPYLRTIQTLSYVARDRNLEIIPIDDFKERGVGIWVEDFDTFSRRQWSDFAYKLAGGECLQEVQERNIAALVSVLNINTGKAVAIGTHGTALSTIINFYDGQFGYDGFKKLLMPHVVRMDFENTQFVRKVLG